MKTSRLTRSLAATAALTLTVGIAGCSSISDKIGEFAGEKVAEKVVEGATGGKADISVDDDGEGSISIKTEEGDFTLQTGSFVEGWPEGLVYPADYQIISSGGTKNENELSLMTVVATNEDFDSVVTNVGGGLEADNRFHLREEPTDISMGELHTRSYYFEGAEFNMIVIITDSGDTEFATKVQYMLTPPETSN